MEQISLKYKLNDKPPLLEMLLYGLQWLAISVPTIIIIGQVVAGIHSSSTTEQVLYIQKLFFVTGLSLGVQILWGHRLPVIIGPASVLLVSIIACQGKSLNTVYTSVLVGGAFLILLSSTGLFAKIRGLFTSRVIAVILLLIAFTLAPTILKLIMPLNSPVTPLSHFSFALIFVFLMFIVANLLKGIWKSTFLIWAIIAGSIFYWLIFRPSAVDYQGSLPMVGNVFYNMNFSLAWDTGTIIAFLISFLALAVNDLGSIQAVGALLKPNNMPKRVTWGITITGLSNVLAGILGVVGMVNFSFSPGVIVSTGCASRYTLLPAGIGLMLLALLPASVAFIGSIPSVVVGSVMIYIMCSQISAGLLVIFSSMNEFKFEYGLVIGLPLMLGLIVSFLPADILNTFPPSVRPIMGNGFVVGVVSVILMEHVIYKVKKQESVKNSA
ncbi:Xanthine/uracil/vitamin C permease [Desulforamulus reducens MI-1]|uniref:Xanthine/uracil/vitamin C permease n=1 Tax=Desulforamulus reducens (strain ATCC BAA-1160 / DSM 100696 / MI-1) TaxID=349161 RepID=A4J3W7_DESRM|nr:solute carrier family 23 protein [Desulforamulus reducens]ABO49770.1 Xanthine/uracil/vitamin C permease [Desulforamulus reducens MI-1]